jgi:ABC-type nitrate/sulfonate/bicarbonate transport system substrate-binding protein
MNRALVLAAFAFCWLLAGPASAQESLRVGFLKGSSALPMQVMIERGIAQKHGVKIEQKEFVDLAAMDRAFVFREFDLHMGLSLNTWGEYLNQGHDFVGVVGTLHPVGFLVVPKASPAHSLADLKGKRVGVYGINGTSTAIFGVVASERSKIDIRKDMKLFGSAPPALPVLLNKGEIDAMLNLPFFVARTVASGQARIVMDPAEEWKRLTGQQLPFTVAAVERKTVTSKKAALRGMVKAWQEAVDYLREHPELLDQELAKSGVSDPDARRLTREMTMPTFMNTWTDKDVENIRTYWKLAAEKNFMQKPVAAQDWYTFDFVK